MRDDALGDDDERDGGQDDERERPRPDESEDEAGDAGDEVAEEDADVLRRRDPNLVRLAAVRGEEVRSRGREGGRWCRGSGGKGGRRTG